MTGHINIRNPLEGDEDRLSKKERLDRSNDKNIEAN